MSSLSITPYFPFKRVKVVGQNVHGQGALIRVQQDQRWRPLCHDCRSPARIVHSQGHRRMIRDMNLADRQVWLEVDYRKIWCERCGKTRVEHLDFCDSPERLTHRMRRCIYDLCKRMSVADVAEHFGLDPKTVTAVDKEFLQEEFGQTDYEGLRVLAMDEIAIKKGHQHFMTVILDYVSGRVVWTGEGRKKETLDRFFDGMTPQQKNAIQAVAIDMWEAYITSIQHHCPQALIVFDLFHIVKGYGVVIDEVRRQEVSKAVGPMKQVVKGSRYLLLKNRDNLQPHQADRLDELLKLNENLSRVYVLKDQLKVIYHYRRRDQGKAALDDWVAMARRIDNYLMAHFIKTLRRFEYGILNHCDFPIGTSRLEGVNNKIKVIKRKAYGFHDPIYFGLKIKQAFPGHDKEPKTTNSLG
jgi:transposase